MGLQLKRGTDSTRAAREPKSIEFKIAVLVAVDGGVSAKDALAEQCEVFGYTLTKSFENYAPSAMFSIRKSVQGQITKGNQEVIDALTDAGLVFDDGNDDGDEINETDDIEIDVEDDEVSDDVTPISDDPAID